MRHTEHSLDRLPTRGMPTIPARRDPVSDRSAGKRRVCGGDSACVGGVDFASKRIEQVVFVGEHVGLTIEDRRKIASGEFVEEWQGFVAYSVAEMGRIEVRWIVDRVESELVTERLGFGASQRQDRMACPVSVRRQPCTRCTAQQVQQHRLGPIVKRVPRGDDGRQHVVASRSGAGFEIRSRRHAHSVADERGAESLRRSLHEIGFAGGPIAQPVVDVVGGHLAPRGDGEHE